MQVSKTDFLSNFSPDFSVFPNPVFEKYTTKVLAYI
jgi:hypothetical protein